MDLNSGLQDRLKKKNIIESPLLKSLNTKNLTTQESVTEDTNDDSVTCIPDTPSPLFKKCVWKRALGKGMDIEETQERKKYKPSPEYSPKDALQQRRPFRDKVRSDALDRLKSIRQKKSKSKFPFVDVCDSKSSKEETQYCVDSDKDYNIKWPSDSDSSSEEDEKLISIFTSSSPDLGNSASFSKKFERLSCCISKLPSEDCLSHDKVSEGDNKIEDEKVSNCHSSPRIGTFHRDKNTRLRETSVLDPFSFEDFDDDFINSNNNEPLHFVKYSESKENDLKDKNCDKNVEFVPCSSSSNTFISHTSLELKSNKDIADHVCNGREFHTGASGSSKCSDPSKSENLLSLKNLSSHEKRSDKPKFSFMSHKGDSSDLSFHEFDKVENNASKRENPFRDKNTYKSPKKSSHKFIEVGVPGDSNDRMSSSFSFLDDLLDAEDHLSSVPLKNKSLDDSALFVKSPKFHSAYTREIDVMEKNKSKRYRSVWNENKNCDNEISDISVLGNSPTQIVSHLNIPDVSVVQPKSKDCLSVCDSKICDNLLISSVTAPSHSTSVTTTSARSGVSSHSIKVNSKDINLRKHKSTKSPDPKSKKYPLSKDQTNEHVLVINDDSDEELGREMDFICRLASKNASQDANRRKARASGLRKNRMTSRSAHVNRAGDCSFITAMDFAKSLEENETVSVVNQLEGDEEMARQLQEEMDREFALSIQNVDSPHMHAQCTNEPVTFPVNFPEAFCERNTRYRPRSMSPPQFPNLEGVDGVRLPARNPWAHSSPPRRPTTRSRSRHTRHNNRGNFLLEMNSNIDQDDAEFDLFNYSELMRLQDQLSRIDEGPSQRRGRGRGRYRSPSRMTFLFGNSGNSPTDGQDYEALWDLAERLGDARPKGLSKSDVNRLPVKIFKIGDKSNENKSDCLICMTEYEEGSSLRILTCFHQFHKACIDRWLEENNTCPICRVAVSL